MYNAEKSINRNAHMNSEEMCMKTGSEKSAGRRDEIEERETIK